MIKKRSKSDLPCSDNEADDDGKWLKHAIAKLNCIPIFWSNRILYDNGGSRISTCTDHNEYKQALKYVQDTSIIATQYDPPCKTLVTTYHYDVRNAKSEGINSDTLDLMIEQDLMR